MRSVEMSVSRFEEQLQYDNKSSRFRGDAVCVAVVPIVLLWYHSLR